MYIEGLDETDNKIIDAIRNNARLSYSEIGEKVGVSRVCVKNRMTVLEQKGVIKGYQTIIDSEATVNEGTEFILDAEVWHDHFDDALTVLSAEKSIRKVYITTGDDHVHAVGITTNHANLRAMVNRLYSEKFFKKISCQTILSTVKDVDGGVDYALRHKESEHMEGSAEQESGADPKQV